MEGGGRRRRREERREGGGGRLGPHDTSNVDPYRLN